MLRARRASEQTRELKRQSCGRLLAPAVVQKPHKAARHMQGVGEGMDDGTIYESGTYLSNNPTWHEEDSPWKAKNVVKLLDRNGIRPTTVCEIGCGAGGILNCLASDYGDDVLFSGYEISPQAFALCEAKKRDNLRFFLTDLLDEDGEPYDVVMAIDVFEHVEDYFGFLRKLRARGKYKIFHVPLDLSAQTVMRGTPILRDRASVGHIHNFMKDTVLATLEDTGYEVVDHFYSKATFKLKNCGWEAALLELPRRICFPINQDLTVRTFGGFSLWVLAT